VSFEERGRTSAWRRSLLEGLLEKFCIEDGGELQEDCLASLAFCRGQYSDLKEPPYRVTQK
jgi:hypothetical protein